MRPPMPMRTEIIPDTLAGAERTPAALHPLPCLPAPRRTSVQGRAFFSSKLFLRQAGLCLFKGDSTHTWSVAAGNARPEGARRVRHRGHCHHVQGCAPLSWRIGPPRNRRRLHVLPKHRRNMCCRQSHRTQLDRSRDDCHADRLHRRCELTGLTYFLIRLRVYADLSAYV